MTGSIQSSSERFRKSLKWRKHETAYFLAGATAWEIILRHVFGRPPGRRTLDVDLGIAVGDWDHLQLLKSALIERGGFQPHARMVQPLIYPSKPSVVMDLILGA